MKTKPQFVLGQPVFFLIKSIDSGQIATIENVSLTHYTVGRSLFDFNGNFDREFTRSYFNDVLPSGELCGLGYWKSEVTLHSLDSEVFINWNEQKRISVIKQKILKKLMATKSLDDLILMQNFLNNFG